MKSEKTEEQEGQPPAEGAPSAPQHEEQDPIETLAEMLLQTTQRAEQAAVLLATEGRQLEEGIVSRVDRLLRDALLAHAEAIERAQVAEQAVKAERDRLYMERVESLISRAEKCANAAIPQYQAPQTPPSLPAIPAVTAAHSLGKKRSNTATIAVVVVFGAVATVGVLLWTLRDTIAAAIGS